MRATTVEKKIPAHVLIADPAPDMSGASSAEGALRRALDTMYEVEIAMGEASRFLEELGPDTEYLEARASFWLRVFDIHQQYIGDAASTLERWFKPALKKKEA